jgi:hypothetical protein
VHIATGLRIRQAPTPAGLSPRNPAGIFSNDVFEQGRNIMAKMTRYSLYYRLMDVSFFAAMVLLLMDIVEALLDLTPSESVTLWVGFPLGGLSFLLPSFCVFARFMRDDFAELLWQKAAGTVLKALIILPLPLAFVFGALIVTGQIDMPESDFSNPNISSSDGGAALGVIFSFIYLWIFTPVIFSLAFQWHRWRASR